MWWLYVWGYRVFFLAKNLRKCFPRCERIMRWYEGAFSAFLNRRMPKWFDEHPTKWGLNTKTREDSFTVSLTSFPARIHYTHLAIETLMRQSTKPDRIVLWLAEDQFPDRQLPKKLTDLISRGLTIRYCDDLRSHKKYYYAFREYPDDHIILADDDLFYPPDTVKNLLKLHKRYPQDIVCVSAQIITPSLGAPPSVWKSPAPKDKYIHSAVAQAFTGAGSLFPARWYTDDLFHKDKAMGMAATADDLWLKVMSLRAGVNTTVKYPARGFPAEISIPDNVTLFQTNSMLGGNQNDHTWQKLIEEYSIKVD